MAELVVALDVPTGKEALDLADRIGDLRCAKVGPALYLAEGPGLVRALVGRNVSVFLDLKWHDIPTTVARAVGSAGDLGVSLATVHCLGGEAMLRAAARAAGDLALVGVTVLTSHDAESLGVVLGRPVTDVQTDVERLARLAVHAGLRGVVASGHEAARLRAVLPTGAFLVVPGIRGPGDTRGDQARTVTPEAAARAGATHVVVGRPIIEAGDPAAAYRFFRRALDGVSAA